MECLPRCLATWYHFGDARNIVCITRDAKLPSSTLYFEVEAGLPVVKVLLFVVSRANKLSKNRQELFCFRQQIR